MQIDRGLVQTEYGHIHYRVAGQGPTALISHINQQSSAVMIELIEALAPRMRAVAFDYPSHGVSDHVSAQPSIRDYAVAGLRVIDALGGGSVHLLGEATGAAVSAEFAGLFPDRVLTATLVNCPYYPDRRVVERNHGPLKDGLRPADESGFPMTRTLSFLLERDPSHAPVNPNQSWMDRINCAQIEAGRDRWQALDALGAYDLAAGLGKMRCPVQILMGEHFHYTSHLVELQQMAGDAVGAIIPGARFCATWEHAAGIAAEVVRFTAAG
jgi:pimeloyl-ACP methyl ester carboxylesterase